MQFHFSCNGFGKLKPAPSQAPALRMLVIRDWGIYLNCNDDGVVQEHRQGMAQI